MSEGSMVIKREWTDHKKVKCRIVEEDGSLRGESYYTGDRNGGAGWRMWLQESEARVILSHMEELDQLKAQLAAVSKKITKAPKSKKKAAE